ncbi:hypothetical protein D3C81_1851920 [compost metagenome]
MRDDGDDAVCCDRDKGQRVIDQPARHGVAAILFDLIAGGGTHDAGGAYGQCQAGECAGTLEPGAACHVRQAQAVLAVFGVEYCAHIIVPSSRRLV